MVQSTGTCYIAISCSSAIRDVIVYVMKRLNFLCLAVILTAVVLILSGFGNVQYFKGVFDDADNYYILSEYSDLDLSPPYHNTSAAMRILCDTDEYYEINLIFNTGTNITEDYIQVRHDGQEAYNATIIPYRDRVSVFALSGINYTDLISSKETLIGVRWHTNGLAPFTIDTSALSSSIAKLEEKCGFSILQKEQDKEDAQAEKKRARMAEQEAKKNKETLGIVLGITIGLVVTGAVIGGVFWALDAVTPAYIY